MWVRDKNINTSIDFDWGESNFSLYKLAILKRKLGIVRLNFLFRNFLFIFYSVVELANNNNNNSKLGILRIKVGGLSLSELKTRNDL